MFALARPTSAGRAAEWQTLGLQFVGARGEVAIEGREEDIAKVNYLIGNDSSRWRTGLSTYRQVVYRELWPGIDLLFRQADGRLKYEFQVRPGARVADIRLAYRGAEDLSVDGSGNLLIKTSLGTLLDQKPTSYQLIDGRRVNVESRFAPARPSEQIAAYGFAVGGDYDRRHSLIIDPGITYSTLLGGTGSVVANGIAVDSAGNAYVVGQTDSPNLATAGAFQTSFHGGTKVHGILDALVAKLRPDGTLQFLTYLGGSDADVGLGVAVDATGNAHVTGYTYSSDFPIPLNVPAYNRKITGGADAFLAKLNASGSGLLYSTYLGGGGFDAGHAIAVDAVGKIYVAGETLSSNFPITPGAFAKSQGKRDAFITKLDPAVSGPGGLVYSTYLGGTGDDVVFGIALNPTCLQDCNAYVAGQTSSPNFPTALAFDASLSGPSDAFMTELNFNGSNVLYSTFLGGSGDDAAFGIAVDGAGAVYVTGQTSGGFPTTPGAASRLFGGQTDAFITKLNPTVSGSASLVYSTYLGGSGADAGYGIAVMKSCSGDCDAYVAGQTSSFNFPTVAALDSFSGPSDAFVAKLNHDGSAFLFSSFLGGSGDDAGLGIAVDSAGAAYVAGQTTSADFPSAVCQTQTCSGPQRAFVAKLDVKAATSTTVTSSASPVVFGQSVTFTATVSAVPASAGTPTGTVTFMDGTATLGTGALSPSATPGTSTATFTASGLAVAAHSITAAYGGDNTFSSSTSAALTQTINKASTSTAIASAANPSVFGQSVTFRATVTPTAPGAGTPTGTVTFADAGVTLGSGTVGVTGQASFTTTSLSVAGHTITAQYGGDTSFGGSTSPPFTQTVGQASTTTTLTASPSAPVFGQSVTLTATVAAAAPGIGTPTGTVTFMDGTSTLGTGSLTGGQATFTTSSLGAGSHSISAVYGGDTNFSGSTGTPSAGSLTINAASTTTTLATSVTPSAFGQPVTFTATVTVVSPGTGTPVGTVNFLEGATTLGTGALDATGKATFTTAALAVATHAITAQYAGSTSFNGSSSAPLSQTVNPGATTTAISASASSTTAGQAVTFTATVTATPPAVGTPAGTVTFSDYSTALGTSPLDASGHATFTTSSLGVGFHSITATYNGSASFATSASAPAVDAGLSQPVISAPTVLSTDRTSAQPLGALFVNCKSQFVTITGTGFLPPTTFPPNIGILFTLADGTTVAPGITLTEVSFLTGSTLGARVDVADGVSGSFRIRVTNPDTGTGISAGTVVDVGNPQPCPAQGLAPSTTSSGTATPPVISSLVPSSGLRGSTVTINGSNFGAAPVVTFTGPGNSPVSATIKTTSTTALTVSVPVFPTNTADAFDGPVFVTNTGLASKGAAFTVTNPRLSVVTPSSAPPALITLDLAGSKLQSGATVQFLNGGTTTPASGLTVNSVTSDGTGQHLTVAITAISATGLLDVVVTNPDTGNSKLAGAFQVKTPPAAGFTFSVNGSDPAGFLPSVDGVSVTLNAAGACTGKQITPHGATLTARFVSASPATPPAQVTFTIVSSNLPGTATNEDCELLSPAASDFSVAPIGAAVPTAPTVQQVANVLDAGGGNYSVTLYSWDWGGNVTVSVSGVTTVGGVVNTTVAGTQALPVDTDGDKLPDAYEANAVLNSNGAGQNALDRLNKDQNGNGIADGDDRFATDGLSNFEKYRGVYLSGPVNGGSGQMTGFTRLGSGLRHLFVRGRGFGNDPAILAAPGTCGIDPITGAPAPDLTLSATNPCPVFEVGGAFVKAGVQVHDVSASFTGTTTFPRQSLATPANPILDMATIVYDGVNCAGFGCSTSKTGARNWTFSQLGFSSYGTATAYGSDSRVTKRAVDAYFSDRPYQRRTAGLSACTASSTTPCFVVAGDGRAMLTPLSLVGDLSNDSGVKDTAKEVVDASGQLLGDAYVAGSFGLQLSAMDANNDGCVELPFVGDPRSTSKCNPTAEFADSPQATKQQVARSLITHELGHNIGINTHTTDSTDIMYQATNNWIRDGSQQFGATGQFSATAAGLIQIHNRGGLQ
jgi:Big-like domain-containing protein/beta-propeller repeat-containing protein